MDNLLDKIKSNVPGRIGGLMYGKDNPLHEVRPTDVIITQDEVGVKVLVKKEDVYTFVLRTVNGLPGYALSTEYLIEAPYRGKKLGPKIEQIKLRAAEGMYCTKVIAGIRADNAAELASIFKREWKNIDYVPSPAVYAPELAQFVPHLIFSKEVR